MTEFEVETMAIEGNRDVSEQTLIIKPRNGRQLGKGAVQDSVSNRIPGSTREADAGCDAYRAVQDRVRDDQVLAHGVPGINLEEVGFIAELETDIDLLDALIGKSRISLEQRFRGSGQVREGADTIGRSVDLIDGSCLERHGISSAECRERPDQGRVGLDGRDDSRIDHRPWNEGQGVEEVGEGVRRPESLAPADPDHLVVVEPMENR